MESPFEIKIEQYPFDKTGIYLIKDKSIHGEDWPVVYILSGKKEAYIGETQNAYERMNQHLNSGKRKNITEINLMLSDSFNKSAILDIENMLITYMHADAEFVLQNANGGQSKTHNYYQRTEYQNVFNEIWKALQKTGLVKHELFELENSEIFKFSPYKELTTEQYNIVEDLLKVYSYTLKGEKKTTVVINGGAGTGKSLIAIYFLNTIANILNNNYDFTNTDDYLDGDAVLNKAELIKTIKTYGNDKIAFVVTVPSFKSTIKKVFKSIKELKHIDVISPSQASRGNYDVLIVDEAHRLKRREKLTNNGAYDKVNKYLGLSSDSTELDWVKMKANKLLILFYDDKQSIKESDVRQEDFEKLLLDSNTKRYILKTQLRVKGGNEYIEFVNRLFTDNPSTYKLTNGYDLQVFNDCYEMFEAIKTKNSEHKGLCRVLSGISFKWRRKARDKTTTIYSRDYDFEIDGHHYCWNADFNAADFITNDENLDKIGCIYTCQGHDLNYAGVIFGRDITYNPKEKRIEYHPSEFKDKNSKSNNNDMTIKNIINAYLVLLTRGMYGTYIYAVDEELRKFIESLVIKNNTI